MSEVANLARARDRAQYAAEAASLRTQLDEAHSIQCARNQFDARIAPA
jgi:hypothetical protein